jgi:glutamine cyclotransferase
MKRDTHSQIQNKLAFLEANKGKIVNNLDELEKVEGEIAALKYVSENKLKTEFIRGLMLGYQKALELIENKK